MFQNGAGGEESGNPIKKESHDFRYLIVEQIIMCIDTNNERPEHELALEQLHGQRADLAGLGHAEQRVVFTQVAVVTSHIGVICPRDATREPVTHLCQCCGNSDIRKCRAHVSPESCARSWALHSKYNGDCDQEGS